jgi:WXG100 family type VII secretion target
MADIIKMDYEQMEQMAKIFQQCADHMDQLKSGLQNVAGQMEQGALVGQTGQAFQDVLRNQASTAVGKMHDKFVELNGDILGALRELRDHDQSASTRFGSH